ncbi:hypothetical protein ACPC54_10905 [Kitasatospora sp. NPDC094028]
MYVQWGTFPKAASVPTALSMARKAMSDQGYTVWLTDDNFNTVGGNDDVIVSVACAPVEGGDGIPSGAWVCVSAYSADGPTAEAARNNVRTDIVGQISFDNG